MGLYSNSAFGPPFKNTLRIGTNTEPNYLFGSFDTKTEPWLFSLTSVAIASNVATVTGTLKSGGGPSPTVVPVVGAKMGVRGTTTNSGAFNVDPATVTAVTFTPSTGAVSVSFALTHANVGVTTDTGDIVIQPAETADIFDTAPQASIPAALIFTPDESDNSRCLFAEAKWVGTLPTTATVQLQVANVDDDSRYATVENLYGTKPGGTVAASSSLATVAGSAVTQSGAEYSFIAGKFIRAYVSAMTGGDTTTGLIVSVFA